MVRFACPTRGADVCGAAWYGHLAVPGASVRDPLISQDEVTYRSV